MRHLHLFFLPAAITFFASCHTDAPPPSADAIEQIKLNRGELIWCGPQMANFGSVHFLISASPGVKKDFDQAIAILHSFEYIEAEKAFANIIRKDPSCTMAYWGVAMSNYHPLWEPPREDELEKGAKAIAIARTIKQKSQAEAAYIEAIGSYFDDWKTVDHQTRARKYEKKMEAIHEKYPADYEAAVFYALALNSTADPKDKTYSQQKHAGSILNKLQSQQPEHPGIIHYIIHTYDNPDLANIALDAARKYASVAPASAHAQHMPSHIFVRLGLWDEEINSNLASINSAKCYAEKAELAGNFDEELHGLDYLMYGYLQQGDNENARRQLEYIKNIKSVSAQNLKVAYAFAAMPSRFVLENRYWKDASNLQLYPGDFPWEKFPWQKGIVVFARLMGNVNTNNIAGATDELRNLEALRGKLLEQKDAYKAAQLEVQIKTGGAWIALKKGDRSSALHLMHQAAELEDGTGKHPVTPGEVLPARELLADMYMEVNDPQNALAAYEEDLKRHVNRFNGLYGAGLAAEKMGNLNLAKRYYKKLVEISSTGSTRPEVKHAKEMSSSIDAVANN